MTIEKTTCTVVVDDRSTRADLRAVHGFACWVSRGDTNLLFDTGPDSSSLAANLQVLNLKIPVLNAVVLSHGHVDHGGGLAWLLARRPDLPVYLHADALGGHFSRGRDAGLPAEVRAALQRADLHLVDGWQEVAPGIAITGPVPRREPFEVVQPSFTRDLAGRVQDLLFDDLSLVVAMAQRDLVVTGCAHAGIINILDHVRRRAIGRPLYGFIGGTHLDGVDDERLRATAERLDAFSLACMAPCHCGGGRAATFLQNTFPAAWRLVAAGTRLEIGDDD